MRLKLSGSYVTLWLSADDTYRWAHRAGSSWLPGQLSGHRLVAQFDGGNLVDFSLDGKEADVDANELNSCVSDYLRHKLPADHPDRWQLVDLARADRWAAATR